MKRVLLLVTMTASVLAVEKREVLPLIENAAGNSGSAYLEIRNRITIFGTNALPLLSELAVDEALPWQQRLVARICYERVERDKDIRKLLATDWYAHPKFDEKWNNLHSGPEGGMHYMVIDDLKEAGLWYYYLEIGWKMTGEKADIRNRRYTDTWANWCAFAVKDNPEERVWFLRVCDDLMEMHPTPPRVSWLYSTLQNEKSPDSVPLLLKHFDTYLKTDHGWFLPDRLPLEVSQYADSRSADLFSKFLQTHPNIYNLTADTVRARPAPPPTPEHFRLGTNIIRRAKQE